MQNIGQGSIDYGTFKQAYDADKTIQSLTHRYDTNGVELKTQNTSDSSEHAANNKSNVVSQTAKRATRRRIG